MNWLNLRGFFERDTVRFYGDFIDPFCYVGFHNLRAAAEKSGVSIRWCGFELNPDTPDDGYRFETAGNSDLRKGMWTSVQAYAQQAGINLSDPGFAPNSQKAHFLILHWPGKGTVKNPLIERIYQAYLSDHKDIGKSSVLIELASGFGVSSQTCEEILRRGEKAILEKHRQEAFKMQFPGMPGYRFRNRTRFGALPQSAWNVVFQTKESSCSTK
jgi:predicted DsbA family dithiol-disulfide isomerase